MSQTLLSFSPAAVGQVLTLTDFDRSWNLGTIRKLSAVLNIEAAYCPRFSGARCNTTQESTDASAWPARAFELSAQWWLSYPYLAPGATAPNRPIGALNGHNSRFEYAQSGLPRSRGWF
jgi:hypothetical protein